MTLEAVFVPDAPVLSFTAFAGGRVKLTGQFLLRLSCRCGWSIAGDRDSQESLVGIWWTEIYPVRRPAELDRPPGPGQLEGQGR
jgi:hypothetical protein